LAVVGRLVGRFALHDARFSFRRLVAAQNLAQRLDERREGGAAGDVAVRPNDRGRLGVAPREFLD
jgi:hypothetical protein